MAQYLAVNIWLPGIQMRKKRSLWFYDLRECVPKMKCQLISVWITADGEHLTLVNNVYVSHVSNVALLLFPPSLCGFTFIWQKSGLSTASLTSPHCTHDQKVWKQAGVLSLYIVVYWFTSTLITFVRGRDARIACIHHCCLFLCQFQQKKKKKSHNRAWFWGKTPGVYALCGAARWAEGNLSALWLSVPATWQDAVNNLSPREGHGRGNLLQQASISHSQKPNTLPRTHSGLHKNINCG